MELEKILKSEAASVSWQDFQAVMEITILYNGEKSLTLKISGCKRQSFTHSTKSTGSSCLCSLETS